MLLVFKFDLAEQKSVLVETELGGFADAEKRRMLVILGTNEIDDAIGLQSIFLAEKFLRVFVLAIRAENLTGDRLAVLFRYAARCGLHLKNGAALKIVLVLGRRRDGGEQQARDNKRTFHADPPREGFEGVPDQGGTTPSRFEQRGKQGREKYRVEKIFWEPGGVGIGVNATGIHLRRERLFGGVCNLDAVNQEAGEHQDSEGK